MEEFKDNNELAGWIYTMELQNTNGRETPNEMFMKGIEAAIDEIKPLELLERQKKLDFELKCWKISMTGLTPGGSEFADDPEYCKVYVKEIIHNSELRYKELLLRYNKSQEALRDIVSLNPEDAHISWVFARAKEALNNK